jgi:hypothetical protein
VADFGDAFRNLGLVGVVAGVNDADAAETFPLARVAASEVGAVGVVAGASDAAFAGDSMTVRTTREQSAANPIARKRTTRRYVSLMFIVRLYEPPEPTQQAYGVSTVEVISANTPCVAIKLVRSAPDPAFGSLADRFDEWTTRSRHWPPRSGLLQGWLIGFMLDRR